MRGRTHYDLLEIDPSAGEHEIRRAYLEFARALHPDARPGLDGAARAEATRRMAEVNLAYETLSDPVRREAYDGSIGADRWRLRLEWEPPPPPPGFSVFPARGLIWMRTLGEVYHRAADARFRALSLEAEGADLSALSSVPDSIWKLVCSGHPVDDAQMDHLRSQPRLRDLDLTGTRITDAGLRALVGLPHLIELSLTATAVTDAGLETLSRIPSLQVLRLGATRVRGPGLAHLRRLEDLDTLDLRRTRISGRHLHHLHGMTWLAWVDLPLRAGARERRALRRTLPDAVVD